MKQPPVPHVSPVKLPVISSMSGCSFSRPAHGTWIIRPRSWTWQPPAHGTVAVGTSVKSAVGFIEAKSASCARP